MRCGFGAQEREFLRQVQQRREHVADQRLRGLVAGVEQDDAGVQHVILGEQRVAALHLHQPAHHVVAWAVDALVVELFQIRLEFDQCVLRPVDAGLVADAREQERGDAVGPVLQLVQVLAARSDDGRDHVRRQRIRELRVQVDRHAVGPLVEVPLHQLFGDRPHGLHRLRRERAAEDPAQSCVIRRVGEDNERTQRLVGLLVALALLLRQPVLVPGGDAIGEKVRAVQRVVDIVVPAEHPAAPALVPVARVPLAQHRVVRRRVLDDRVVEQVVVDDGGGHRAALPGPGAAAPGR